MKMNSQDRARHYTSPCDSVKLVTKLDYTDGLWKNYYVMLHVEDVFAAELYR